MAVWAFPCSDVQCLHAGVFAARVADLAAGIPLVDDRELASVPFGLVFEHGAELSPACVQNAFVQTAFRLLPVVRVLFRVVRVGFRLAVSAHVLDSQVLDDNRLVFTDDSGRELVEKVCATVLDLRIRLSHLQPGFTIVVASFLLPGEFSLRQPEFPQVFFQVSWIVDFLTIAEDGEVFQSHVDADHVSILGWLEDGIFDQYADVPTSSRVQADSHAGWSAFAWQGARPSDGQWVMHFSQRQRPMLPIPCERGDGVGGGTALVFRFESRIGAGLVEEPLECGLQMP